MDIIKGEQYSIGVTFRKQKTIAAFANPPIWTLYNSADEELFEGVASNSGTQWFAVFTIPPGYVVPGGKEELLLQFSGHDQQNSFLVSDKSLTLTDANENFTPNGIVYNAITNRDVRDTLILPVENSEIRYTIIDPTGKALTPMQTAEISASSATSNGYAFTVSINPGVQINTYTDPYQVIYEYTVDNEAETEIHPLYILDAKTLQTVNYLQSFLDKAQLLEVDLSLQWYLPELIQATLEGVKYINASAPDGTFWTTGRFPPTLDRYLNAAAMYYALEMRGIAEGLNSFEFSGLNTNLNYNRAEFINSKLGDINGVLANLPTAKRSAINISGKGIAAPGVSDFRKRNLGMLGLSVNPLNNRIGYGFNNRFRRV